MKILFKNDERGGVLYVDNSSFEQSQWLGQNGFWFYGKRSKAKTASTLQALGITLNRNSLPFDGNGPWYTSGLRVGTPALTTLGMGTDEMREIASVIKLVLSNTRPSKITRGKSAGSLSKARFRTGEKALAEAKSTTAALADRYPVYPELDLEYLQRHFG